MLPNSTIAASPSEIQSNKVNTEGHADGIVQYHSTILTWNGGLEAGIQFVEFLTPCVSVFHRCNLFDGMSIVSIGKSVWFQSLGLEPFYRLLR